MSTIKKRLLVLGGGFIQIKLIEAAKTEGYCVIVFDYNDNCLGRKLADEFYNISIIDKDAVLKKAQEIRIDGVVANSEAAMAVVSYVCDNLGLVGTTEESIRHFSSKHEFRKLQNRAGVYSPKSIKCNSYDEFLRNVNSLIFPIIIKPNESSGSRGTTKIDSIDQIGVVKDLFIYCSNFSRDNSVTIEEYVEMPTLDIIGGDIFIHKGHFYWSGLMIEHRSSSAPMIPLTEMHPVNIPDEQLDKFKSVTQLLFKEAGVTYGEYNVEAYFNKTGDLFYIEINARQGGDGIQEHIRLHSSLDMNKLYVTTAVGDDYYFNETKDESILQCNFTIDLTIYPQHAGAFKQIFVDPQIAKYVHHIDYHTRIGEQVRKMVDASDSLATAYLVLPNRELQAELFTTVENYIYPIIDEN